MGPASILVGRSYRTAEGEIRRVTAMEGGQVSFDLIVVPRGPGMSAHETGRRLPLAKFAEEVESDVTDASGVP